MERISKDVEGSLELKYGGSVSRHTSVKGLSDNDMLVFLNNSNLVGKSPKNVQVQFMKYLKRRFPNDKIKVGNLAVTVKFKSSGEEIQLLPAIKTSTGMRIADPTTGKWTNVVKPQKFAEELTNVNQQNGGKVVPAIKLIKPIIASLPKKQRISGYHLDALATEIFKTYQGPNDILRMANHFFKQAALRIQYPVQDGTGQSEYIDDNLGKRRSERRMAISTAFADLDERMEKASQQDSITKWKEILDGVHHHGMGFHRPPRPSPV